MRILTLTLSLLLLLCAAPLHAQHRPASPWHALPPAQEVAWDSASVLSISPARYAGMFAGGTLGSAAGLLSGFLAVGASRLSTGCIDCGSGFSIFDYALLGAGSAFGTSVAVAGIAEEPTHSGFWSAMGEIVRTPVFRPALVGALLGIGTGAAMGALVDPISPEGEPYQLVAYNVGQAATSTLAIYLWMRIREGQE